ncbi:hypothetical protein [Rubritalea tangerina]|uniref:hypothetical protein n=1 Tax=Rubritalea tangerina TaxID=430798 RepID=UPI003617F945
MRCALRSTRDIPLQCAQLAISVQTRQHRSWNFIQNLRTLHHCPEAVYSGLWSFIIVNLMNIIPSSKSWIRLPELSAFHAMSQISFLGFQRF